MYVSINKRLQYGSANPTGTICGILTALLFTDYLRYCKYLKETPITEVSFGALYNWYAANDARGIAAEGWHLSTIQDLWDLMKAVDPDGDFPSPTNDAATKIRETGTVYWDEYCVEATNEYKFNARGAGMREDNGNYTALKSAVYFWTPDENAGYGCISWINGPSAMFMMSKVGGPWQILNKKCGASIRLVNDSTVLSHGQEGIYLGNDGKAYRTIVIGTKEYLADNLCETKFRTGDDIPIVTNNSTWASMTSAAMCAYNNDWDNV